MPVVRTFISHTGPDLPRIQPLLRQVAPLGIRPWLDKEDLGGAIGGTLTEELQDAIFRTCQSMTLCVSAGMVARRWPEQELRWARQGVRLLPIALEDIRALAPTLPAEFRAALQIYGAPDALSMDRLFLDPADDRFAEKFACSALSAAGADQAEDVVLHLGHRREQADADVPPEWAAWPVLDLRLGLLGHRDFSPSAAEWQELDQAMALLRRILPGARRLHVCGQAPLALAGLIGKHWDRRSGVASIEGHNQHQEVRQVWTTLGPEDEARAAAFTPETAQLVRMRRPALADHHGGLLLALLPAGNQRYAREVEALQRALGAPPLRIAEFPPHIGNADAARALLTECVGALHCIRRDYGGPVDLVTTLPLGMQPLFFHHHRHLGPLRVHDLVLPERDYRLAFTV